MISDIVDYVITQKAQPEKLGTHLFECLEHSIDRIKVYEHPLGFLHYDLTAIAHVESGGFARLHIWDHQLSTPDAAGNVHDHTWHLHSMVLTGALRDRTYQPAQSAMGAMHAVQVIYGTDNKFVDAGAYHLTLVRDQTFTKGDIYTIPSRMVHKSQVITEPTVTFVVGIPDSHAQRKGPLIFSRNQAPATGTPRRKQVSSNTALNALRAVTEAVSGE